MFNYFLRRLEVLGGKKRYYRNFIDSFKNLIDSSFEDWSLNFLSNKEMENCKKKLMMLKRILQNEQYIETPIDWKLEEDEWINIENKVKKIDIFHIEDYADFPRSDFLVQLAGLKVEFNLSEKQVSSLLEYYKQKVVKEFNLRVFHINEALQLAELYYLFWKINFYSYILFFLTTYAYNKSCIRRKLSYLKFLFNALINSF
jgi:hypothetical protein